jgi:exopolyphosphatase/guanosine-5'-triphosphate,3'-diphosphate pyrophosphatase
VLPNLRFEVLASEKEMVRLGSGSGDMKYLRPEAIDRGVACLVRFRQLAAIFGADLRAVATSAVREAENQGEFIDRARSEAGVDVDVVSGVEEARLIHLGVLQALPVYDRQLLLVDIGGGSTEFLVGKGDETLWARSLKLGAIRLTERFFPEGRVTPKRTDRARQFLRSFLAPSISEIIGHGFEVAVGSSGTIENLAVVAATLRDGTAPRSTNGYTFTREDLDAAVDRLLAADSATGRARIPGVEAKRADIIAGGALLLQVVFEELGLTSMTFSAYALREGILLDEVCQHDHDESHERAHHLTDLRRASVEHLLGRYETERPHAEWSTELALQLFSGTRFIHCLPDEALEYLEAAGLLANIGRTIAHDAHHKHSYYLIRHTEALTGFTSHEIELVAQVARYHRKSAPSAKHAEFASLSPADQHLVRVLAGLLRLGIALDRGHRGMVRGIRVRSDTVGGRLVVEAVAEDPAAIALELYTADATKGLAEQALGQAIEVRAARPGRA